MAENNRTLFSCSSGGHKSKSSTVLISEILGENPCLASFSFWWLLAFLGLWLHLFDLCLLLHFLLSSHPFPYLSSCPCSLYTKLDFNVCVCLAVLGLSCGLLNLFSCSIWDLVPLPGIEPRSLNWQHDVLATEPPGKSLN